MKTWQEQMREEARRMDAVCDSLLAMGGDADVRMRARDKVCDAIVILTTELKRDAADAAKTAAGFEGDQKTETPAGDQKTETPAGDQKTETPAAAKE